MSKKEAVIELAIAYEVYSSGTLMTKFASQRIESGNYQFVALASLQIEQTYTM